MLQLLPVGQCEQLVKAVREWEKRHVPPMQVVAIERDAYLALLHDLYAGRYEAMRVFADRRSIIRWNPKWLNLRRAAREGVEYFQTL